MRAFKEIYFDIETTDLQASMGRLLCVGWHTNEQHYSTDCGSCNTHTEDDTDWDCLDCCQCESTIYTPDPNSVCSIKGKGRCAPGWCDREMALKARDAIESHDICITWNGKLFDIPFLNARLVKHGDRPVHKGKHVDAMYLARATTSGMRLRSSRLAHVSSFLDVPHRKTPLDPDVWRLAMTGDQESFDKVVYHNHMDVIVTSEVFNLLRPLIQNIHR